MLAQWLPLPRRRKAKLPLLLKARRRKAKPLQPKRKRAKLPLPRRRKAKLLLLPKAKRRSDLVTTRRDFLQARNQAA